MAKTRIVEIRYSRLSKKFLYVNNLIGGTHFVKDEIAALIKKKLKITKNAPVQRINIQRPGEIITYIVTVLA